MAFSRKRTWGQRARSFANGAYQGYQTARAIKRARTNSRTNSTRQLRSDPFPITGENDASRTYRRKPMPRRKRRAWVKFTKRVGAVQLKNVGSNYLVLTRTQTLTADANKQTATGIHTALGLNSASRFCNDMAQISAMAGGVSNQSAYPNKFVVSGWMMETQIKNDSASQVYIDLYYWRCTKRVPRVIDGLDTDASALVTAGLGDLVPANPTGGSSLDIADYGVTPFQSPQFYKSCKVYKKLRVKLAVGGVTQIETRSGRNYFRNYGIDEDYGMDRCTEGVLMFTYGTPSATNATSDPVTLRLSTNVNYTYKVLLANRMGGGTNVA